MKAPDPDKVAALRDKAARLAQLKDHPSWAELRNTFQARRQKHFDSVSRQLLAGAQIDQRYIDRMAGFFKGAEWILDHPDVAESSLESALRRVELFEALREETS